MLGAFIDWLFEKWGRKYAFVDFTGAVIGYRYYLGYVENHKGQAKFLPNAYVHHFIDPRGVDGASGVLTSHFHPWNAASFIFKGGYLEEREGLPPTQRKAGRGHIMPQRVRHAVSTTIPNTWTLFVHGFKKQEWQFSMKPCEVMCGRCAKEFGVCQLKVRTLSMDDVSNGKGSATKDHWRGTQWHKCGPEFDRWLAKRRKAVARIGGVAPPERERVLDHVREERAA
jgi:hypothetical protein